MPNRLVRIRILLLLLAAMLAAGCASTTSPTSSTIGTAPAGTTPGTTVAVGRPSAGCEHPGERTDGVRTLTTPDGSRTYRISFPAETATPAPLVLLIHGYSSSAAQFASLTRLPEAAAAAGMVTAVPDGAGSPATWSFTGAGPDAAFVDALIDEVAADACIDLDRVMLTGFSAGAAFTIAYTCAHRDAIRAMATVAVDFNLGCTQPTSLLAFHGTADPMVPYEDGAIGLSLPGTKVRGTELNLGDWAALDGCATPPAVEQVGSEVRRTTWSGCAPGTELGLWTIVGGGHSWPGADPARSIGLTTQQVDATKEIVAFFGRAGAPR